MFDRHRRRIFEEANHRVTEDCTCAEPGTATAAPISAIRPPRRSRSRRAAWRGVITCRRSTAACGGVRNEDVVPHQISLLAPVRSHVPRSERVQT
jgi:hypothetical protein